MPITTVISVIICSISFNCVNIGRFSKI